MSDWLKSINKIGRDVSRTVGTGDRIIRQVGRTGSDYAKTKGDLGHLDDIEEARGNKHERKAIRSEAGVEAAKIRYLEKHDELNAALSGREAAFGTGGSDSSLAPSEALKQQKLWNERDALTDQLAEEAGKGEGANAKTLKNLEKKIRRYNDDLGLSENEYRSSADIEAQTKKANEQSANTRELVDAVIAVNSANAGDRTSRVNALLGVIHQLEESGAELGPIAFEKNGKRVTLSASELSGDLNKVAVHISEELSEADIGKRRAKPLSIDEIERVEGKIEAAKTANVRNFEALMEKAGLEVTINGKLDNAELQKLAEFAHLKEIDLPVKNSLVASANATNPIPTEPDLHIDNPKDKVTQELREALVIEAKDRADAAKNAAENKTTNDNTVTTNTEVTDVNTKPKTADKHDFTIDYTKQYKSSSENGAVLQTALEAVGFATEKNGAADGKVDGAIGTTTKAAIKQAEAKYHVTDDDAAHSKLMAAMLNDPKLQQTLKSIGGNDGVVSQEEIRAQVVGSLQNQAQGTGKAH